MSRSTEKPRRGQPPVAPGGTRRINVTLDALTEDRLRELSKGNLSAGIRIAAEIASRARRR